MTIKLSDKGGGAKAPTSLDAVPQFFIGGDTGRSAAVELGGCKQSASVTSASLTEVLNISGAGVLTFAGVHTAGANPVSNSLFRIVIDGNTVLDDSANLSDQDAIFTAVGALGSPTNKGSFNENPVPFKKSLVISISGDGTDGAQLSYKRYLT